MTDDQSGKINIEQFIIKFLKENYYVVNEDKTFEYIIYDISDKCFDNNYLKRIIQSEDPYETFNEIIFDLYSDNVSTDDILNSIRYKYPDEYEKYYSEISDWIWEHICIKYPDDDFLDYKYPIDIIINTGDGNYDYTLNCVYPHYNGRSYDEIEDEASVLWLARTNGYSKKQFENARKNAEFNGSKFLKSVYEEILNCTSHMNALVFLAEMTLKDIIDIQNRKKLKYIKISKDTNAGLYDLWSGAGGLLEIFLEKDIVIPSKYIDSCMPDGIRGYGIDEIYGADKSLWQRGGVTEIRMIEDNSDDSDDSASAIHKRA